MLYYLLTQFGVVVFVRGGRDSRIVGEHIHSLNYEFSMIGLNLRVRCLDSDVETFGVLQQLYQLCMVMVMVIIMIIIMVMVMRGAE